MIPPPKSAGCDEPRPDGSIVTVTVGAVLATKLVNVEAAVSVEEDGQQSGLSEWQPITGAHHTVAPASTRVYSGLAQYPTRRDPDRVDWVGYVVVGRDDTTLILTGSKIGVGVAVARGVVSTVLLAMPKGVTV